MSDTGSGLLTTPFEGLLATPTGRLPYQHDVLLRSYVLRRPQGSAIVYNSPGISTAAHAIEELGGADVLLINHAHEAMYGAPSVDVPAAVHELDRPDIARAMPVSTVFSDRHRFGDDLEAIPTPGHTAGTTSYLWDDGRHRFLFTGDFIWIEHGEWKAVVLDGGLREQYLASLALVRDLEFDVLVPWGATEDGPPVAAVSGPDEIRTRIDAIVDRVRAGARR